jgi:transcriptional regulator with XRE-family HTH domain
MRQTTAIHAALKRLLKARGRTYADAAAVLGLSEPSIKRLFSRSELSLERLERLCDWLGVDIADVVGLANAEQPRLTELTPAQERELLADTGLLLIAYLVLNRWRLDEISNVYAFTGPELTLRLVKLERLGLIELLPFDRIKLRTARNFSWRKDGPIQQFFAERVLPDFLATRFEADDERMHFVGGLLSAGSIRRLQDGVDALARLLDDLVAQDLSVPTSQRQACGLFVGMRRWEFSGFGSLRRVPRAT